MHYPCKIVSCTPLSASVSRVILCPINNTQLLSFYAGQHLCIHLPSGETCPFSIASSPRDPSNIELHILSTPEQETSQQVFEALKQPTINIKPPEGECYLANELRLKANAPLILIAAGTGLAQMQSIIHEMLARKMKNPIYLYRGARKAADLYHSEHIQTWSEEHSNFHYLPVVSEAMESCQWGGREGLLYDAVCADFENFKDAQVFISGSPVMVYATLDVMVLHGLKQGQAHSDTFHYAPR